MIELMSGKTHYWQWDTNQKLIIVNPAIEEVHFSNDLSITALVCAVYEEDGVRVVDVPNVLLQTCNTIRVYAVCDNCTMYQEHIKVYRRSKPDDYVYTETEVKRYEDLEERITNLELGGGVDVDLTNYYTKEEIDTINNSGKFELIEEITITEDTASILRTQYPDGTEYSLKSIIIQFDSTNAEVIGNCNGWVRLNSKKESSEWRYISYGAISSTNQSIAYYVYRQLNDNSIDSYSIAAGKNTITTHAQGGSINFLPNNVITFNYIIKDIYIYTSGETPIPANTKITIWGVRA